MVDLGVALVAVAGVVLGQYVVLRNFRLSREQAEADRVLDARVARIERQRETLIDVEAKYRLARGRLGADSGVAAQIVKLCEDGLRDGSQPPPVEAIEPPRIVELTYLYYGAETNFALQQLWRQYHVYKASRSKESLQSVLEFATAFKQAIDERVCAAGKEPDDFAQRWVQLDAKESKILGTTPSKDQLPPIDWIGAAPSNAVFKRD